MWGPIASRESNVSFTTVTKDSTWEQKGLSF